MMQRLPGSLCRRLAAERPLLTHAASGQMEDLERALLNEESAERDRDRRYWLPLRTELEKLRHAPGRPANNAD